MGQINDRLRRAEHGYGHWCPGCREMHVIPDSWSFDGDLDAPTFNPSVKITGKQTIKNERGEWTGEWIRDSKGNAVDLCCHYFLHAGDLQFCGDSTHESAGSTVPLPMLPSWLRD